MLVDHQAEQAGEPDLSSSTAARTDSDASTQAATDQAWRREVASRVQQHRARRRKGGDPNALELDFTGDEPYSFAAEPADYHLPPPPPRFAEIVVKQETPKIIRFPRNTVRPRPAVEEVTLDELALSDSGLDSPRILESPDYEPEADAGYRAETDRAASQEEYLQSEVETQTWDGPAEEAWEPALETYQHEAAVRAPQAEQMELLPNFEDIRLEPEANRLIDELRSIPRPAPLSQRALAGVVDAGIVFIACGVFAATFLELAEEMPHSKLIGVCGVAVGGAFWLLFQYLFLIHGRGTPGMQMAQLELCSFEGKRPSLLARQTRALASTLSAFAAGMGYAWALVDEDRLGWHDRISQTHLRSCAQPSPYSRQSNHRAADYR